VPFVGETNRDAVVSESPDLLDEPVVEFALPFPGQERFYLRAVLNEFCAILPAAIRRVSKRNALRITSVPRILGHADFLKCRFKCERREWRAALGHRVSSLSGPLRISADRFGSGSRFCRTSTRSIHFRYERARADDEKYFAHHWSRHYRMCAHAPSDHA
jgi:hypothetical protein